MSVVLRLSARARRYRLLVARDGSPVLTVPRTGRLAEAEAFLDRNLGWLDARLRRAPRPVPLAPGAVLDLRGVAHRVVPTGRLRGRVTPAEDNGERLLLVPGAPEHLGRRLFDWLKAEALQDLRVRVAAHAATLGVSVKRVGIRDQSSRWGSCSSSGNLSFNWRLVLAPPFVLDYLAAHEVAHLREMNHAPAFWAEVRRTLPDMDRGRAWIKANGNALMAVRAP